MRRLLLALAILIIFAAVAAPAVLVWAALFTSGGLQFVIGHIPQQIGGVRLTITGVSGTVARGLSVERVEIEHEVVHLTLTGIEGRVALRPLVLQTIRVAHGKVQSALIEVKHRAKPPTPGPNNFLPAWLMINVEDASVGSARLTVYTGFHLAIFQRRGQARGRARQRPRHAALDRSARHGCQGSPRLGPGRAAALDGRR